MVIFWCALSAVHEESKVQLWEKRSKDDQLGCCNQELWLVMPGSVEASEVLNSHKILGDDEEEKGSGDEGTGETEEHPNNEEDNHPHIVNSQGKIVAIPICQICLTFPSGCFPSFP